jgi:hypothetical protein
LFGSCSGFVRVLWVQCRMCFFPFQPP